MAFSQGAEGGKMTQEDWLRLLKPGLDLYRRSFEPTEVGADGNSVPNSALSTLKVIGRSINKSTSAMGAWTMADLTLGLYKVAGRHANAGIADTIDGKQVTNRGELEALLHWLKWAMAAYKGDRTQLARTLGVSMDRVIRHEMVSAVHKPAYYVVVDEGRECVVLGIRGTHAASDVLTDITPHSEDFKDGFGHSGMLQSARWLMGEVGDILGSLLRTKPGYDLVLVGHSLGAGTAALLSMLLQENGTSSKSSAGLGQPWTSMPNWCWAFACPPCVSKELAINATYINCIVLQDDVVARASPAALEDLRAEILDTDWSHTLKEGTRTKRMVETAHATTTGLEDYMGMERGSILTGALAMGSTLLKTGTAKSGILGSTGATGSGGGSVSKRGTAAMSSSSSSSSWWTLVADTVAASTTSSSTPAGTARASTSAQAGTAAAPTPAGAASSWISAGAVLAGAVYELTSKVITEDDEQKKKGNPEPRKSKVAAAAVAASTMAKNDVTSSKEDRERQRLYTPGVLYHIVRKPLPEGQEAPPLEDTYASASGREVPMSHGAGRGDTWQWSLSRSLSRKKAPGTTSAAADRPVSTWIDWTMGWSAKPTESSGAIMAQGSEGDMVGNEGRGLIVAKEGGGGIVAGGGMEGSLGGSGGGGGGEKEWLPHWKPSYDEGWDDKVEDGTAAKGPPKPMKVQHLVVKGTNPQSRFKRIVLSNTMLYDHGTQSYRDGLLDAMRYA